MKAYGLFAIKRLLQLFLVMFLGVSGVFLVTQLSPIDPVENMMRQRIGRSNFSPEAEAALRAKLTEMLGVDVPMWEQYVSFLKNLTTGDMGPSLAAFPTPVMQIVFRALPWTLGLLFTSVIITWTVGNLLGGLAGYFQKNPFFKLFGVFSIGIQPIPYYIIAFILLMIFGIFWTVLPINGGAGMFVKPGWNIHYILSILHHSILPAGSIVLGGFGMWFLGMRALVSNIVTEDYVTYAEMGGVEKKKIVGSYVIRNALLPQLTALAMVLGGVFSGTVITEEVFGYPGLGRLLIQAIDMGDYVLVVAVGSISVVAVATSIFVIDLLYPLLDPRVRAN